jgi:hypothetical protein
VATGILVFDFELFIGGRVQQFLTANSERWLIRRNNTVSYMMFLFASISL